MLNPKTIRKFSILLSAISTHEASKGSYRISLSPEVTAQMDAIENCLYGLLDRLAYSHLDRDGKPIHIDAKTARAFQDTVNSVHENEGKHGKSDEHWFNILTRNPEGTMDGVLKVEREVAGKADKTIEADPDSVLCLYP